MDRSLGGYIVHGVADSDMTEQLSRHAGKDYHQQNAELKWWQNKPGESTED